MTIDVFLQVGVASFMAMLAAITLWHTVVIKPITENIKDVRDIAKANTESIHALEVNHAQLNTTLNSLTEAINKLSDKMDNHA